MKIYISIDMEGLPGTWNWEQENSDRVSVRKAFYDHTKDVVEAVKESPENSAIDEIVIADSHAACDNLSYSITELDRRVKLVSGVPRRSYMMPALNSSFNLVFLLGYHAGYGTINANMDHTYCSSRFQSILINNIPMNESLINAAYAGAYGIPVALVTGDLALRKSLIDQGKMPWVEFVTTKDAVSKLAAVNFSAIEVRENTKNAVTKVLHHSEIYKNSLLEFAIPIKLTIELKATSMADVVSFMPCINRIDGRTVEYVSDNYKEVFETIIAIQVLASSVKE